MNDLYSITANHYLNAGLAGLIHFNLLLNAFLKDIKNSEIEELNSVYALLLYKGHSKERTLDSSYRTISTCVLVAKGLDILVREHSIDKWNSQQAVLGQLPRRQLPRQTTAQATTAKVDNCPGT